MKKIILFLLILVGTNQVYATCYTDMLSMQEAKSQKDYYSQNSRSKEYLEWSSVYFNRLTVYGDCLDRINDLFDKGYAAYGKGKYEDSIFYFSDYLNTSGDTTSKNYASASLNLVLSYYQTALVALNKNDYEKVISISLKSIQIDPNHIPSIILLGRGYTEIGEFSTALKQYEKAYDLATDSEQIKFIKAQIDSTKLKISEFNLKKNQASNDVLSYLQYYLNDLNVPSAWKLIDSPKQVIIAIIDDGISINHPDLTNNIWKSSNSAYGDSKIINFTQEKIFDNLASGDHGTMVAGIIGASTGNKEGIAGIAKNVKLMPIKVFDSNQNTKEEYIISGINYAIENGANIINLSIGGSQFKYSKGMDEVIKKAYDKGIFVVIAAGNGDILSNGQNGVNLDINPISPVCNNKGKAYSFGVIATDEEGYRTNWTNYGKCAPFFAPGENIVSTSISVYNKELGINYNQESGTSFSAPIVSGILGLGYNKFGKIPFDVAYNALGKSTTINSKGNPVLDAEKYLKNLESHFNNVSELKKNELIIKAQKQFQGYKKQFSKFPKDIQTKKYKSILTILQKKSKLLRGDVLITNNAVINLINQELKK